MSKSVGRLNSPLLKLNLPMVASGSPVIFGELVLVYLHPLARA
jgi:hypothetical protein